MDSLTEKTGHTAVSRIVAATAGMAGSFVMFAAYLVVPLVGIFSGLAAPFPAAYCRFRYGRAVAATIILGATAAMSALFGVTAGIFYLVQCGLISLMMSELLLKGFSATRSIAWTTAACMVLLAAAVAFFSMNSSHNIHGLAVTEIQKSVEQAVAIYEKGGVKGDDLQVLKQTITMAADLFIRVYPALVTVALIIMAGCNMALLRRSVSGFGYRLNIGEFKDFRNPEILVWLLIVSGFAQLVPNTLITTPALNVLTIMAVLYFLQGLAVLYTVIARQGIPGVLMVVLHLMLVLQPYLAALVVFLGIFDLWGDFRTPRKQENL